MKPILFNTEMVKSILDGRKTVTRRAIKLDLGLADTDKNDSSYLKIPDEYGDYHDAKALCKYQVGDVLYVRETWQDGSFLEDDKGNIVQYIYKADDTKDKNSYSAWGIKWKPSLHMPKDAARIFLKVTDVRIERIQDITEIQVAKEGFISNFDMESDTFYPDGYFFVKTWDNIYKNKGFGWESNPYVWVVEFERIK